MREQVKSGDATRIKEFSEDFVEGEFDEIEILDENELKSTIDDNYKSASIADDIMGTWKTALDMPLFTAEEERDAFTKYKENPTQELRDEIFYRNIRLVISIAKHYKDMFTQSLDFSDLIQEGSFGLLKSIDRFDVDKGYKFSTYASWWIRQSITRAIGDKSTAVRIPIHMREKITKYSVIKNKFTAENGREPDDTEMQELLQMSDREFHFLKESIQISNLVSLETPVMSDDKDKSEFGDFIPSDVASPDEESLEKDKREVLLAAIDRRLTDREKFVIDRRFGLTDGVARTLEDVGKDMKITRERVRQIECKALRKLRTDRILAQYAED